MDNIQSLSDQELDAKIAQAQSQQSNGNDLSKLSDDELDSRISNAKNNGLKSIAQGQLQGANDLIKVANTSIKKLITGNSFQDDADANSQQYARNTSFKGMNADQIQNKLGDIQDSSFKNSFLAGTADTLTTPTMIAGTGAKYAGMAKDAIGEGLNEVKNGISRMALNPEFRSTASTRMYGQDGKRVMQSMPDIVGKDVPSTLAAVNNKTEEVGKAISDTINSHPNANVKLNAAPSILKPFSEKIAELNKQDPDGNSALIERLKNAQQSLIKKFDENGNVIGTNNLQSMTPDELFNFRRQKIDPKTRYTGNPSDDKDLNTVFQKVKSNVRDLQNGNMPELKPLNQDYGDLHAAGDALQKLSDKIDNEGLPNINWKDVTTLGIHKWLSNPINRINMSRWLYTAPDAQIQQASNAIPGFTAGVRQSYGGVKNATLVTTPKGVSGSGNVSGIGKSTPIGLNEPMGSTTRTDANAETSTGNLPNPNTSPINQPGYVPKGLPEPFQGRTGVDRPWENQGLPTPRAAGQSSGPVINQGTNYTPPVVKKYPQTDFGYQIKNQMQQKENVPLHPAEAGREELARIYPAAIKGNPNISSLDLKDFNDMKDWELSQNPGGIKVTGGRQTGPDRNVTSSPSGHSEAFKKVSGNSEKVGFDLLKRASNGEEMTPGEQLKIKMMIHDFRKNIKPKMG